MVNKESNKWKKESLKEFVKTFGKGMKKALKNNDEKEIAKLINKKFIEAKEQNKLNYTYQR